MRALWQLAWTEFKLNLREPLTAFWSLAFPALWLVFNAVIFKEPIPGSGYQGLNYASYLLPGAIGLVVLSASFVGLPIALTTYRETGALRRLRATPVKTGVLGASLSLSNLAFVAAGILVLLLVARVAFRVQVLGSWVALIGVTLVGMITFLAIGCAIGSVAPSLRAASIIIWSIFTPMLMLSEIFLPIAILPGWLQPIARALPLTPLNTLLRDIVYGVPLTDLWRLGLLAGWAIIAGVVTVLFFRWE